MAKTPASDPAKPAGSTRDDRLKAALKANLARRKAQARGRAAQDAGKSEQTKEQDQ